METGKNRMEEQVLEEKAENLIAIGAATAANCIPCFEHLYEKAITSGISVAEIKRASDIAGQVKKGAHITITNSTFIPPVRTDISHSLGLRGIRHSFLESHLGCGKQPRHPLSSHKDCPTDHKAYPLRPNSCRCQNGRHHEL